MWLIAVCLLEPAVVTEAATKIKIKKKSISKTYNYSGIRRIAIYPVCIKAGLNKPSSVGLSRRPKVEIPADSVLAEAVTELVARVNFLDSAIEAVVLDNPDPNLSDRKLVAIADSGCGADAVLITRVTRVDGARATPVIRGSYEPTFNGPLPPLGGAPASTTVRVKFTLTETRSGEVIWEVDAEGKESGGGTLYSGSEIDPPATGPIIKDLVITAGSWLPF